jgi:2Fe-2S ferredoxin
MLKLNIIDHEGCRREFSAQPGESVMQILRAAGLPMPGECNGSMACATCHVVVDPAWAERLEPPCDDEEAALDVLFSLTPTSRLGCQIRLSPALDGIELKLPSKS